MAKLADAQVSGSCGRPWGFKSLRPHHTQPYSNRRIRLCFSYFRYFLSLTKRELLTPQFKISSVLSHYIQQKNKTPYIGAINRHDIQSFVVGTAELESATSCMSSKRSNQLSYAPANTLCNIAYFIIQDSGQLVKQFFAMKINFYLFCLSSGKRRQSKSKIWRALSSAPERRKRVCAARRNGSNFEGSARYSSILSAT